MIRCSIVTGLGHPGDPGDVVSGSSWSDPLLKYPDLTQIVTHDVQKFKFEDTIHAAALSWAMPTYCASARSHFLHVSGYPTFE